MQAGLDLRRMKLAWRGIFLGIRGNVGKGYLSRFFGASCHLLEVLRGTSEVSPHPMGPSERRGLVPHSETVAAEPLGARQRWSDAA